MSRYEDGRLDGWRSAEMYYRKVDYKWDKMHKEIELLTEKVEKLKKENKALKNMVGSFYD